MNIVYQKIAQFAYSKVVLSALAVFSLTACTEDPNSPGVEFMPDMYRSTGYEAYLKKFDIDSAEFFERNLEKLGYEEANDSVKLVLVNEVQELFNVFKSGIITRKPVDGTVASGKKPFPIKKGDRSLAKAVKMPIPYTETSIKEGKAFYEIFCDHCHGAKGQGKGALVEKELFLKPPAYNSGATKDLSAGEIFYTIQYGKGMMGSHASQISAERRWKIVQYVQTLQGNTLEDLQNGKVEVEQVVAEPDSTVTDTIK